MSKNQLFLLLIVLASCRHRFQVLKTGLEGKKMPAFNLTLVDTGSHVMTNAFADGRPMVLFSFDPSCPYCRAETESMIKNIKMLDGIDICMLTSSSYSEFKAFYDRYHLNKYRNITPGIDRALGFIRYFQAPEVPVMAIYDSKNSLKTVLIGLANVEAIKKLALE